MLQLILKGVEKFDSVNECFVYEPDVVVELEHSLLTLSKWESKWEIPFLGDDEKTSEQTLSYIECMDLQGNLPADWPKRITEDHVREINSYISAKNTATWFGDSERRPGRKEVVTSEIMYHWMFALQMPMECERWHLNRFITQVKVINEKNAAQNNGGKKTPPTKSSLAARREMNAKRRQQYGTGG